MSDGFYCKWILSGPIDIDGTRKTRPNYPKVEAVPGLEAEERGSGVKGTVVSVAKGMVTLRGDDGRDRRAQLREGSFMVGGKQVTLIPARSRANGAAPERTASGSIAVRNAPARIARACRILVEGVHDAELVEKVWGDDLRVEGVVVEYLQGVDLLGDLLQSEPPGPGRRYGVLVDHLVPGSKESRIAQAVERGPHGAHLRIVGHPHIDVWQCVRPEAVGIAAWPDVPRGIEWKVGVSRALGWPARDQADIARTWQRILGSVRSYRDLDPALLGRVEELIDFVTAEPDASTR